MKVASVSITQDPLFLMPTGDGFITLVDIPTATLETHGTSHSALTIRLAPKNVLLTVLINKLGKEPTESRPMEMHLNLVSLHKVPIPRMLDPDLS